MPPLMIATSLVMITAAIVLTLAAIIDFRKKIWRTSKRDLLMAIGLMLLAIGTTFSYIMLTDQLSIDVLHMVIISSFVASLILFSVAMVRRFILEKKFGKRHHLRELIPEAAAHLRK